MFGWRFLVYCYNCVLRGKDDVGYFDFCDYCYCVAFVC